MAKAKRKRLNAVGATDDENVVQSDDEDLVETDDEEDGDEEGQTAPSHVPQDILRMIGNVPATGSVQSDDEDEEGEGEPTTPARRMLDAAPKHLKNPLADLINPGRPTPSATEIMNILNAASPEGDIRGVPLDDLNFGGEQFTYNGVRYGPGEHGTMVAPSQEVYDALEVATQRVHVIRQVHNARISAEHTALPTRVRG